jgi:hypothetical protein
MSEMTCEKCGEEYALRDGMDPTPLCDECAHKEVEELTQRLKTSERQKEAMREAGNQLHELCSGYSRGADVREAWKQALSPDAGSDFVPKSEVEALRRELALMSGSGPGSFIERVVIKPLEAEVETLRRERDELAALFKFIRDECDHETDPRIENAFRQHLNALSLEMHDNQLLNNFRVGQTKHDAELPMQAEVETLRRERDELAAVCEKYCNALSVETRQQVLAQHDSDLLKPTVELLRIFPGRNCCEREWNDWIDKLRNERVRLNGLKGTA